jgi:type I restriction enzyme S subunit
MENGKGAVARGLRNGLGCGTTELHVIRPIVGISPYYLYRFLAQASVRRTAKENFTGSAGQSRVPKKFIEELVLPIAPLPEQKRIVAKLEKLLAKVDACRQRLEKISILLKRFRQSVLAAACSGRLTVDWREKNSSVNHPNKYLNHLEKKDSIIEQGDQFDGVPESWTELSLNKTCTKITDGEHLTPRLSIQGIPLLSAKDVRDNFLDFLDTKFVTKEFAEKSRQRCNPEKDDILVVSRGATVGRTSLVRTDEIFCLMGSVLLFKPNKTFIMPQMIEFFFKSPEGLSALIERSGSTAQQAIYIKDMRSLNIPVPPLAEQQEIVRRVEALFKIADRIEERYQKAKAQVDKLTQSILAKAFRGELVPQDPNDEPASVLLERIRQQKLSGNQSKNHRAKRKPSISPSLDGRGTGGG